MNEEQSLCSQPPQLQTSLYANTSSSTATLGTNNCYTNESETQPNILNSSDSLSSSQKQQEFQQSPLSSNKSNLTQSFENMSTMPHNTDDNSKTLEPNQEQLEKRENVPPINDFDSTMPNVKIDKRHGQMRQSETRKNPKRLEKRQRKHSSYDHSDSPDSNEDSDLCHTNMPIQSSASDRGVKQLKNVGIIPPINESGLAVPNEKMDKRHGEMRQSETRKKPKRSEKRQRKHSSSDHSDSSDSNEGANICQTEMSVKGSMSAVCIKRLRAEERIPPVNYSGLTMPNKKLDKINGGTRQSQARKNAKRSAKMQRKHSSSDHSDSSDSNEDADLCHTNMSVHSNASDGGEEQLRAAGYIPTKKHFGLAVPYCQWHTDITVPWNESRTSEETFKAGEKIQTDDHLPLDTSPKKTVPVFDNKNDNSQPPKFDKQPPMSGEKHQVVNLSDVRTLCCIIFLCRAMFGNGFKTLKYDKISEKTRKNDPSHNHLDLVVSDKAIRRLRQRISDWLKGIEGNQKPNNIEKETQLDSSISAASNKMFRGEQLDALFSDMASLLDEKVLERGLNPSYNRLELSNKHDDNYWKTPKLIEQIVEGIEENDSPSNRLSSVGKYGKIGEFYEDMGDYVRAVKYYEESVKILEETVPINHPLLSVCYKNIARLYDEIGEFSKANEFYGRSLKAKEKAQVPNFSIVVDSYNNSDVVYHKRDKYSAIQPLNKPSIKTKRSMPQVAPSAGSDADTRDKNLQKHVRRQNTDKK